MAQHYRSALKKVERDLAAWQAQHGAELQKLMLNPDRGAAELIDNYVTMHGKMPSPAQLEKLASTNAGGMSKEARRLRIKALNNQRDRLYALRRSIEREMSKFAGSAYGDVRRAASKGIVQGAKQAGELVSAGAPGLQLGTATVPTASVEAIAAQTQKGGPVHKLFKQMGGKAADEAVDKLVQGVTLGRNPRVIARDLRDTLNTTLGRATTIARTEVQQAHRAASQSIYMENADVVKGWTWYAQLATACGSCAAMHGTSHKIDESLHSHPNCRCAMLPETFTYEELGLPGITENATDVPTGEDAFNAMSESDLKKRADMFGPAISEAMQKGDIQLADLVHETNHPVWGKGRRQASLKQALAKAAKR